MNNVALVWNVLRFAFGVVLVLAGLDKVFATNFIVEWPTYISPFVASLLPIEQGMFLIIMGVVEVLVGILFITSWPRIAGYLSVLWLVLISINLMMMGSLDIAIRDLLLALGAWAIAELTIAVKGNA